MPKYVIDKKFQTRVHRSERVLEIANAFGLGLDEREFVVFDNLELEVNPGEVVYITGQSGSGKSLLLKELERLMTAEGRRVVNLDHIPLDDTKAMIDQIGRDTNDAIRILSVAGLNDAYLFLRRPKELSDGQRYRFRLAKAIESKAEVIVVDEFMAVLDRTAAKVIAFSLQKTARAAGITVIVATTHTDMVADLHPDLFIEKRYREKLAIRRIAADEALEAPADDLTELVQAVRAGGMAADRGEVSAIVLAGL